jgi:hypothetical protein
MSTSRGPIRSLSTPHLLIAGSPLPLRTCVAERVPPACPFSGSRGVNSGHSRHPVPSTRRSALAQLSPLIVTRSSKLGLTGHQVTIVSESGTHRRSYASGGTVDQRSHQPTGSQSSQQSPGSSYAGSPTAPAIRRRRPGMREQGWSRSGPPATGRAKSVPDAAVTHGVQRGVTGTPIVTPHYGPWPVIAGQGQFLLVWRVKDSNLGRHQPTDLQIVFTHASGL